MTDTTSRPNVDIRITNDDGIVSLTARDDSGTVVGSAVLDTATAPHPATFVLEVMPAARGNGVGRALFTRMLDEASALGLEWIGYTGPADETLLRLAATSGSVCARRVTGDIAKSVILVPHRAPAST